MDTEKNVRTGSQGTLPGSIAVLEMLSTETASAVLDYFREYPLATFSDLLIHCREDASTLEAILEQLLEARILLRQSTLYDAGYQLNHRRLRRIAEAVAGLTS